jgi:HK97 family phage prohead protease
MARLVVTDLDDTLVLEGDKPNEVLAEYLRRTPYEVYIVSGRSDSRLEETRAWLEANNIPHAEVYLSDFPEGPNASREFKLFKAEKLLEEGHEIVEWYDNEAETRQGLRELGINAENPAELEEEDTEEGEASKALTKLDAPEWLQENAKRGLEWYEAGYAGDGIVDRTIREARAMADGFVSEDKAVRMAAWFARHMGDLDGITGDEDPPTPGMVAHALWGGYPRSESERAQRWAENNRPQENSAPKEANRMEFKNFTATANVTEAGTVEAIVSVFGNVDYVGDRVMPGAFSKTLENYAASGRNIPFVWSHDYDTPESYIGKVVEAEETSEGLKVRAELFDTPRAQVVRELLVNRVVSEFSFAYEVIGSEKATDGYTNLTELNLLECGPTLRGANPMTRLLDAKATPIRLAELPNNYRPSLSEDVTEGRACGNCAFYDEENVREDGEKVLAFCTRWEDYVDGAFYCNAWQANQGEESSKQDSPREVLQGEKAGRTLSSKNEGQLRDAVALIEAVLSSVQDSTSDATKAEESRVETKTEQYVRDPRVALALLDLAKLSADPTL